MALGIFSWRGGIGREESSIGGMGVHRVHLLRVIRQSVAAPCLSCDAVHAAAAAVAVLCAGGFVVRCFFGVVRATVWCLCADVVCSRVVATSALTVPLVTWYGMV